jgi:hypothetical protein
MCSTLNHQNIIEMAQGHISLSICSSHMMVLTICTNSIHLSRSFINYEGDIGFMNKFICHMKKYSIYKLYIMMSYTNL